MAAQHGTRRDHPDGFRRDATIGLTHDPLADTRRYAVEIMKGGVMTRTILRARDLHEATSRAGYIFDAADSITVSRAEPTQLERIQDRRAVGRSIWSAIAITVALLTLAIGLVGCSSGSGDDEVETASSEPVISCDSQGNCTTYPPGTTAEEIDEQNDPPEPDDTPQPPTRDELNAAPNGKAWDMDMAPGGYLWSNDSGICLLRWPYEVSVELYDSNDFQGACFSAYHHDWYFRIGPFKRTSDQWVGITTSAFRGERRLHEVVNRQLTGSYDVTGPFLGSFYSEGSLHDEFRLYWNGGNQGMRADSTALAATEPGVYSRARRSVETGCEVDCTTDVDAPYLNVGVETSLTINADGTLYAQGADGCVIEGATDDDLGGVMRYELTNSCAPGAFKGLAGTISGRVFVGAHYKHDHFVIVGE